MTRWPMHRRFPAHLLILVKLYAAVLVPFTLFRTILFLTELDRIGPEVTTSLILQAFLMGARFDLVIAGYLFALPFLLITVFSMIGPVPRQLIKAIRVFLVLGFALAFLVCAVDIPYFNQFFARFSITAFEWMESPVFVVKMIVQEPRYWLAIVPFLAVLWGFNKALGRIMKEPFPARTGPLLSNALVSLVALGLVFLGIRGRADEKSPIRVGTAYFSDHAFLNQLGLNPNFTLIRSWLDSKDEAYRTVRLMDDEEAVALAQGDLGIAHADPAHPLARQVRFDAPETKHNVVVVIMESMSAAKMARHGNTKGLVPFLDSLSHQGVYFENAYSAGIHTFNGVFSTIFSFPALFRQHPMKESSMLRYHGLFSALREHDYSTAYFTTHDGQFDNAEGFMRANACERVITKADYPAADVKTTLGVPDDRMFAYALPILDEMANARKPFVAAFMTASDHGPYYVPEYFVPHSTDIKDQVTEYADYSLRFLIAECMKRPWFANTLFVFVADHGAAIDGTYDMSLDYNHTPLLFFAPHIMGESRTDTSIAGQIDAFPTIMGILRAPFENRTLGIDLFREKRPYIYFNADDKYGVLDGGHFLVVREEGSRSLYAYREKSAVDRSAELPDAVERMDSYARAHMQAAQYVIRTNKQ